MTKKLIKQLKELGLVEERKDIATSDFIEHSIALVFFSVLVGLFASKYWGNSIGWFMVSGLSWYFMLGGVIDGCKNQARMVYSPKKTRVKK